MGILYVSGDELDTTLTSADGEGYIHKPYTLEDLLQALRTIREIKLGGVDGFVTGPRGFRRFNDYLTPVRPAA